MGELLVGLALSWWGVWLGMWIVTILMCARFTDWYVENDAPSTINAVVATIFGLALWPIFFVGALAHVGSRGYLRDRARLRQLEQTEREILAKVRIERKLEQEQVERELRALEKEL